MKKMIFLTAIAIMIGAGLSGQSTSQTQDRTQDQTRLKTGTQTQDQTQLQTGTQTRDQTRLQTGTLDQLQTRKRDRLHTRDQTYSSDRLRKRDQIRLQDGSCVSSQSGVQGARTGARNMSAVRRPQPNNTARNSVMYRNMRMPASGTGRR